MLSTEANFVEAANAELSRTYDHHATSDSDFFLPYDADDDDTPRGHRVRRQSEGSGIGGLLTGVGGRLTTMRDSMRETIRPVASALNPRPVIENVGKYLTEASTNTMTRGRTMFQGVRDFGSRSVGRVRDGMTDAWDNVRDGWEEFWDL